MTLPIELPPLSGCQEVSVDGGPCGAGERIRTPDRLITNQMLCQLSYAGSNELRPHHSTRVPRLEAGRRCRAGWLGGRDSNPDKQIQSLPCYRYTTSQQGRRTLYVDYTPYPSGSFSAGARSMRIAFVGAGAVGGYFGARMAHAGLDAWFVLRPASARELRDRGLRVQSPLGDVEIDRPNVWGPSSSLARADVAFFACKAEHVRSAAETARPAVGDSTVLIPLQNGVDAPSVLSDAFGPERVCGGLSRIFAEREAPGRIVHMGMRPSITIGEAQGGESERVSRVVSYLSDVGGMKIDATPDIWTEMWKKLLMVCSIGVVGAASGAPLGILLTVPETRRLLEAAGSEIGTVARATGASIDDDYASQQIARYGGLPPDTTASMHRDLERGDPSELREQLGSIRRYGSQKGLHTPVLDALYGALLPGELRARGEIEFSNVEPRSGA